MDIMRILVELRKPDGEIHSMNSKNFGRDSGELVKGVNVLCGENQGRIIWYQDC